MIDARAMPARCTRASLRPDLAQRWVCVVRSHLVHPDSLKNPTLIRSFSRRGHRDLYPRVAWSGVSSCQHHSQHYSFPFLRRAFLPFQIYPNGAKFGAINREIAPRRNGGVVRGEGMMKHRFLIVPPGQDTNHSSILFLISNLTCASIVWWFLRISNKLPRT